MLPAKRFGGKKRTGAKRRITELLFRQSGVEIAEGR